jgi:hypothetical protein
MLVPSTFQVLLLKYCDEGIIQFLEIFTTLVKPSMNFQATGVCSITGQIMEIVAGK